MKLRALIIFLLVAPLSFGQTRNTGSIRGRITDPSGAVIVGCEVTITNVAIGLARTATSDSSGEYVFPALPLTGSYELSVSKAGFAKAQQKEIALQAGQPTEVTLSLRPSGGNAVIDVEGAADGIRPESTELLTRFDTGKLVQTPILSRRLTTAPLMNSSVRSARGTGDQFLSNTLFVVNGSGRRQTTWSLDNSTGDDSWGRQSLFTTIPFAAVQEMTVLTNASSAEYGRSMGAAVNVVTKSGTNTLHGDLLVLWRPGSIQAAAPLATSPTADRLWQGSASLSGPIIKDRTFFFVTNEYNSQIRDSVYNNAGHVAGVKSVFPGDFEQDLFLARIDHRINAKNNLFVRANFDRFDDTNPADAVGGNNQPSTARTFSRKTYAAQISETALLTPNLVNEARFQFQLASPITEFQPVVPETQFTYAGFATEGESRSGLLLNHQYQWGDTVSWVHGRHTLKMGGDVIYSSNGGFGQEFGGGFVLGQFTVRPGVTKPVDQLTLADVSCATCRYSQAFGNLNYNVKETLLALFVQDNFAVTQNLTLNLGLRYDYQSFTGDANNLQPRIGFAYRLPNSVDRPVVIRASYGMFSSEIRGNLAAGFKIGGPEGIFTFSALPGQLGFPASLDPLPAFPPGAVLPPRDITVNVGERTYLSQFFDVSKLRFYPDELLNPYTQQWAFGVEQEIAKGLVWSLDYLGQHAVKLERPVDLNAPAEFIRTAPGQTRSGAAADATRPIVPVPNGYRRIIAVVNSGQSSYNGLQAQLRKRFSKNFSGLLTYTWSHTISTVEIDAPGQDPNDSNCITTCEKANSLLDQRHRVSASGWYVFPYQITVGGWVSAGSGRPFNATTGVDNNGDGSNSDRPVIAGTNYVVSRNFGHTEPVYDISLYLEKTFRITERFSTSIRAESFNLTNHNNIVGKNGTYGNAATGLPSATFGTSLTGINNTDPSREFQFALRLSF